MLKTMALVMSAAKSRTSVLTRLVAKSAASALLALKWPARKARS